LYSSMAFEVLLAVLLVAVLEGGPDWMRLQPAAVNGQQRQGAERWRRGS
jgi:hypothetical protein